MYSGQAEQNINNLFNRCCSLVSLNDGLRRFSPFWKMDYLNLLRPQWQSYVLDG